MNPALSEPDLIRKADRLCIFRQDGFHGERPLFQFAVLCPHQRAELPGPDILRFAELRKACAERIKQIALLHTERNGLMPLCCPEVLLLRALQQRVPEMMLLQPAEARYDGIVAVLLVLAGLRIQPCIAFDHFNICLCNIPALLKINALNVDLLRGMGIRIPPQRLGQYRPELHFRCPLPQNSI